MKYRAVVDFETDHDEGMTMDELADHLASHAEEECMYIYETRVVSVEQVDE